MDEKLKNTLQMKIDEQKEAADWREAFSTKQQDKARFFITLVTSETFAIGLSLNTMPPQKWLWAWDAGTFLGCFAACFGCLYFFVRVLMPKTQLARDEFGDDSADKDEEVQMRQILKRSKAQNEHFDDITDDQGVHLQRGVRAFWAFNVIFAVALVVSRLAWFFPADG